ncbi:MAG: fluoride efflux transporter CrcB [Flavobacteriaceae bacterium]
MKQLLLVFIGGGFGSALRFVIGKYLNTAEAEIPWGTFTANILGSLIIGIILGLAAKNDALSSNQTLLLATGFCGGFTTFSTFAYENHVFLKSGDFTNFALYTISSFIVAFLAVFAGLFIAGNNA